MGTCDSCGAEALGDQAFCIHCGAALTPIVQAASAIRSPESPPSDGKSTGGNVAGQVPLAEDQAPGASPLVRADDPHSGRGDQSRGDEHRPRVARAHRALPLRLKHGSRRRLMPFLLTTMLVGIALATGMFWFANVRSRASVDSIDQGGGAQAAPGALASSPMFRGGPARTGSYQGASMRSLDPRWQFDTGVFLHSSPAVAGGTVYVGSGANAYALDAATGVPRWIAPLGDGSVGASSPAVGGDLVFFGISNANGPGTLHALDARTGTAKWTYAAGSDMTSSPVLAQGTVFVGTGEGQSGTVHALDAETGSVRWRFAADAPVISSPAVAGGVVIVGSDNGTVYALDAATGSMRWRYGTGSPVQSAPAVFGDQVFVADSSALYALSVSAGSFRWSHAFHGTLHASPAVSEGSVFIGSLESQGGGGAVFAFDTASGATRWKTEVPAPVLASPALAGGTVVIGSLNGTVLSLDAGTGRIHASYQTGNQVRSSPAIVGGVVFIGSGDGKVYALGEGTGGVSVSSPPVKTAEPSSAPTATTTTASAPPATTSVAVSTLQQLESTGKGVLLEVPEGSWVPQLSSKCAALRNADLEDAHHRLGFPDGRTESYGRGLGAERIRAFHLALVRRFGDSAGVVLTSPKALGIEENPSVCGNTAMWITLAAKVQSPSSAPILAWCDSQKLPPAECGARRVAPNGSSAFIGR